jgi:phage terminase large subunit
VKIKSTIVFQRNWQAIHAVDSKGERLYKYIKNEGSSRSSKTYSMIDCYDLYARAYPDKRLTIWRETKKDCKDTVMVDFEKRLRMTARWVRSWFNKTESVYQYPNGSRIEFRGTDEESVYGLTQDAAWFNEPYSISKHTFDQIDQRTSDFVFIDWNPKQDHYIDNLDTNPRCIKLHSTFMDNPFCPPEMKIKILSYEPLPDEFKHLEFEHDESKIPKHLFRQWRNHQEKTANLYNWQVFGLGLKGEIEGKVFSNYEIVDEIPEFMKFYGHGFDYGYSRDPTAIVSMYHRGKDICLDERIYMTDLQPTPLDSEMRKQGLKTSELIVADRTANLMIDELFDRGWGDMHEAEGDNSIAYGIAKMRETRIYITRRSVNLIREFDHYRNKKDKFGKFIEKPDEGQEDHAIDASRYIITDWFTRVGFELI